MAKASPPRGGYEEYRESQAAISRDRSSAGREIGPLPDVVDPGRRNACLDSLQLYCETYRGETFRLAWSDDHLKAIAKLESAILSGGLFALAMPRGGGKTSLVEAAAEWAILYGHRQFVVLIGATAEAAVEMLDSIKLEFEANELLGEDFPEVCYPVRRLEGINNRSAGQTLDGERTRIVWTDSEIVLPTVRGSASSGARVRVAGITGRVRGMKAKTEDGRTVRPDFAIADDPQTDESSDSSLQTDKRERTLLGAVKGLAGPGKTISMVVPCTVIRKGDLSDRILDRDLHPQFQGERFRMVYSFPAAEQLWERYAELRRDSLRNDRKGEEATEFYAANRAAMDAGAAVGWADRFDPAGELSAIQAAMNLRIDNPKAFAAEYQNDPAADGVGGDAKQLDAAEVGRRTSGLERGVVPRECSRLTAFIDVGGSLHWYAVVAWAENGAGSVIDYGCWPRQTRAVFEARDAKPSLADTYPGHGEPQRVFAGLRDLTADVLGRAYTREGGGEIRVERCLIDCGWQPAAVYQFVRQSGYAGVIYPSKGIGRTTTIRGVSEWKPRPGERSGFHWRLTGAEQGRGRMVQFDPDAWKTLVHGLLTVPLGGVALTLFGKSAGPHELLAGHLAAEYSTPVTLRGATFDKWQVRPDRPDNHLLDCVVGAALAASVSGLTWAAGPVPASAPRPTVRLSDIQAGKRAMPGNAPPGGPAQRVRLSDVQRQRKAGVT